MAAIPQLAASVQGLSRKPARRTSPASIWENAAYLANQRKKLEHEERLIDLAEAKEAARQDEARYARERQGGLDLQARGTAIDEAYQKKMAGAQTRYAGDVGIIQSQETHDRASMEKQRRDDFAIAKWGLANRDPRPIMNFINKHGSPDANVQDIQFGDDGAMIVYPEGNPDGMMFNNPEEFFKGFLGWLDPEIQKQLLDRSMKEREQARKEKKTDYDVSGAGKRITPKEKADLRAKGLKAYNDEWLDPWGNLKPKAPSKEEYLKDYMVRVTGSGDAAISGQPGGGGAAGEKPPIEGARKAPDGHWYIMRQGKYHRVHGGGRGISGGPGEKVRGAIFEPKEFEPKEAAPEKKGKAIPSKGAVKQTGTAYYKDAKTGNRIKATYYSDGTVDRKVVDRKSKKKKKGKDNND
jgi:hypothetical protein